jgi:DHA2 family multidrug resistance protein-like MFS transporter
MLIVGLVAGAAFVYRQLTAAQPLFDLRLFRLPAFGVSLAAYMLATFALFGAFIFVSQYLQLVFGLSALQAGISTMPWALSFVVGSLATPLITRHVRAAHLMVGGLAIAAVGFGLLTLVDVESGLSLLVAASVVVALGLAPVFTLATDQVIGSAPAERAGAAAALSETSSEFGGALGIAILGSIGAALYRGRMTDMPSTAVSPDVSEAARNTLAGAVASAAQLPAPLAGELLANARVAFAESFQLTTLLTAAVVLVAAVLVALVMRETRIETVLAPATASCE